MQGRKMAVPGPGALYARPRLKTLRATSAGASLPVCRVAEVVKQSQTLAVRRVLRIKHRVIRVKHWQCAGCSESNGG